MQRKLRYLSAVIGLIIILITITHWIPKPNFQVDLGHGVNVQVPEYPLASGAFTFSIDPKADRETINKQMFQATVKLGTYWTNGLASGYAYVEKYDSENPNQSIQQLIPYPNGYLMSLARRLTVIWNLVMPQLLSINHWDFFGTNEGTLAALTQPDISAILQNEDVKGEDPFCDPSRYKRQEIYEGKNTRILYNYNPLVEVDLLIIPKQHLVCADQLTPEIYAETMAQAEAIRKQLLASGYHYVYFAHANGKNAGQTVFHWHLHVTGVKNKSDELMGYFGVLLKMVGLKKPLDDATIQARVEKMRALIKE